MIRTAHFIGNIAYDANMPEFQKNLFTLLVKRDDSIVFYRPSERYYMEEAKALATTKWWVLEWRSFFLGNGPFTEGEKAAIRRCNTMKYWDIEPYIRFVVP